MSNILEIVRLFNPSPAKADCDTFLRKIINSSSIFKDSVQFAQLNKEDQHWSPEVVETFTNETYSYCLQAPEEWDTTTIEEICLEFFSTYHIRRSEFFGHVAPVLSAFFGYLAEYKILENAAELQAKIQEIGPRIVPEAQDSSKWSPKKVFYMKHIEAGLDESDPVAMDSLKNEYQKIIVQTMLERYKEKTAAHARRLRPAVENPFKILSRNQIITVQYADGSTREGKFKRLETI